MKNYRELDLILQNAVDLLRDGNLLYNARRYPRSFALFQLGIEEMGKATMLFLDSINQQASPKVRALDFSKQHQTKTRFASVLKMETDSFKSAKRFDILKNASLYVNIDGPEYISPNDIIDEKMAFDRRSELVGYLFQANILLKVFKIETIQISKMIAEMDLSEFAIKMGIEYNGKFTEGLKDLFDTLWPKIPKPPLMINLSERTVEAFKSNSIKIDWGQHKRLMVVPK